MNLGYIYSTVALVGLCQLFLIYNRITATSQKETIDWNFCRLLIFYSIFTFFDCLWVFCYTKNTFITKVLFDIVTYSYHILSMLSAFLWFGYMVNYLKPQPRIKKRLYIFRYILLIVQVGLNVLNLIFKNSFYIKDNLEYTTGILRVYMYFAQFLYYIVIIMFSLFNLSFNKQENKRTYQHMLVFSLIPLVFGILQFIFFDVAFYSMGFMMSAFVIYTFDYSKIREENLYNISKLNEKNSKIDELTKLPNRRAYESDIHSEQNLFHKMNFVYVSMDLNGLKDANDTFGHQAGDNLLKSAADCMKQSLSPYGTVYRTGGDEFSAIIFADSSQLENIKNDFEKNILNCKNTGSGELYISTGYASRNEFPELTINELAAKADERMYEKKREFYESKGIDRRGRNEAYTILSKHYKKMLLINLKDNTHKILNMDYSEKDSTAGYSENYSEWIKKFYEAGLVHPDDKKEFFVLSDLNYLKEYFKTNNSLMISYRRKENDDFYMNIAEIFKAEDYSEEKQKLFLFIRKV